MVPIRRKKHSLMMMHDDAVREAAARAKPTLDVIVVSCSGIEVNPNSKRADLSVLVRIGAAKWETSTS